MNPIFSKGANRLIDAIEAFVERIANTPMAEHPIASHLQQCVIDMNGDVMTAYGRIMMSIDEFIELGGAYGWGNTKEFIELDIAVDEARAATLVAMGLRLA